MHQMRRYCCDRLVHAAMSKGRSRGVAGRQSGTTCCAQAHVCACVCWGRSGGKDWRVALQHQHASRGAAAHWLLDRHAATRASALETKSTCCCCCAVGWCTLAVRVSVQPPPWTTRAPTRRSTALPTPRSCAPTSRHTPRCCSAAAAPAPLAAAPAAAAAAAGAAAQAAEVVAARQRQRQARTWLWWTPRGPDCRRLWWILWWPAATRAVWCTSAAMPPRW